MSSVSSCGKLSFFIGVASLFLGIYLLYKELAAKTFIIHESIAVAFICLSFFFLFHFCLKKIEARSGQGRTCRISRNH